jgi:hypothetical protein
MVYRKRTYILAFLPSFRLQASRTNLDGSWWQGMGEVGRLGGREGVQANGREMHSMLYLFYPRGLGFLAVV